MAPCIDSVCFCQASHLPGIPVTSPPPHTHTLACALRLPTHALTCARAGPPRWVSATNYAFSAYMRNQFHGSVVSCSAGLNPDLVSTMQVGGHGADQGPGRAGAGGCC